MNMSLYCPTSSQNGWNSLMAASQNGYVEVVDKLLQHGATVDLQDKVSNVSTEALAWVAFFTGLPQN